MEGKIQLPLILPELRNLDEIIQDLNDLLAVVPPQRRRQCAVGGRVKDGREDLVVVRGGAVDQVHVSGNRKLD